jgi:hypothetical protein
MAQILSFVNISHELFTYKKQKPPFAFPGRTVIPSKGRNPRRRRFFGEKAVYICRPMRIK